MRPIPISNYKCREIYSNNNNNKELSLRNFGSPLNITSGSCPDPVIILKPPFIERARFAT